MKSGAKLEEFATLYPTSFYDVGIAEEHAAIMAAGIALNHQKVVLLYYSTFMQRAYDEILNDIARQNLSVIIGIDRAGVVGEDGATHQGIYDIAMLSSMPNMLIAMPKDLEETIGIFNYAFYMKDRSPFAIREKSSIHLVVWTEKNNSAFLGRTFRRRSSLYLGLWTGCRQNQGNPHGQFFIGRFGQCPVYSTA